MRARALIAVLALALGLTACGEDEDAPVAPDAGTAAEDEVARGCSAEPPHSKDWKGAVIADETGEVAVDDFNSYLEKAEPPISTSPCDAGSVFAHADRPLQEGESVDVVTEPEDSAEATVTVTFDGLADDSVDATRTTMVFEPADGDVIRLAEANIAYRCKPGRGHQDFSAELCV